MPVRDLDKGRKERKRTEVGECLGRTAKVVHMHKQSYIQSHTHTHTQV